MRSNGHSHNVTDNSQKLQIVTFVVNGQLYGVKIHTLREVVPMMAIESLPNGPSFLKGVINLRGEIIPVVDLKERFGSAEHAYGLSARVMITSQKRRSLGFIVDDVKEVEVFGADAISPAVVASSSQGYVESIAKRASGKVVQIIALDRVLDEKSYQQLATLEAATDGR